MAYATVEELAEYLYQDQVDLPDDAERLLDRASEYMDKITLGKINVLDTDHETAAQKATCAQVEWWIENDDEFGIASNIKSIKLGNFSTSYNATDGKSSVPVLAPRARDFLFLEGLLNPQLGLNSGANNYEYS